MYKRQGISAYVLCKQDLNWKQKIAKWLTGEEFNKYDYLYASRTVIKNQDVYKRQIINRMRKTHIQTYMIYGILKPLIL